MVFVEDLDDLLSQMEDIKFKAPPAPPPKPPTPSSSSSAAGSSSARHGGGGVSNGGGHHHHSHGGHKEDCPHVKDYVVQSRDETHPPHIPAPWGQNLEDHTTSNTLFPTPAPPIAQPLSPVLTKKREVIKSPFDPETRSDQLRKFGINDSNEDFKFNSYHLDYKYTPPPIKGPCAACGEGIIGPMVTALDQMWHPEHFCCANCDRELRPPYFIEHEGSTYCKPCHQRLFLPPCGGCRKTIADKYINALGKVWHPECFTCTKCGCMLPEKDYKEKDGKAYCEKDYNDLFPKCGRCTGPIIRENPTFAMGTQFHPKCFNCTECGKQLSSNNFKENNGKPYCLDHWKNLFPKCAGCNKPITEGRPDRVLGRDYHPGCLKCTEPNCGKQLSPNNFFEKDGNPLCEQHYKNKFPTCQGCGDPIINQKPERILGRNYHPGCLKCMEPNCGKSLSPNNFFEKDGIPLCELHYKNKFPTCHGCREPIINQKPLVAGGKTYHPDHFCCDDCGKKLSPSNFFQKNGAGPTFCEDCYHDRYSQKCTACQKPIKDNKPTNALGRQWHPSCFKCSESNCGKQLSPTNFFEKNGKPLCENCWKNKFPQCFGCKKPIIDTKPLVADNKTWHPDHFCCNDCGKNLNPGNFFQKNGTGPNYCEDCYHQRFSKKCDECHQPIKDNRAVQTNFRNYHAECFRCTACNKQLAHDAFYEYEGKFWCADDYHQRFSPKCKGCHEPITDASCIFALGGDWHIGSCFRCKDCNILLEETNFFEFEGDGPYCERHWHERMCPDCIKMRRALERYCGKTNTMTTPIGSHQAYKTLNLPPRPNSRQSQSSPTQQRVHFHDIETTIGHSHNHEQLKLKVPSLKVNDERPASSQSSYSIESVSREQRNGSNISPYSGSERTEYSREAWSPSPMPLGGTWNGHLSTNGHEKTSSFNSGKFPVGNQMFQFETSFQKEEYQAVSRH